MIRPHVVPPPRCPLRVVWPRHPRPAPAGPPPPAHAANDGLVRCWSTQFKCKGRTKPPTTYGGADSYLRSGSPVESPAAAPPAGCALWRSLTPEPPPPLCAGFLTTTPGCSRAAELVLPGGGWSSTSRLLLFGWASAAASVAAAAAASALSRRRFREAAAARSRSRRWKAISAVQAREATARTVSLENLLDHSVCGDTPPMSRSAALPSAQGARAPSGGSLPRDNAAEETRNQSGTIWCPEREVLAPCQVMSKAGQGMMCQRVRGEGVEEKLGGTGREGAQNVDWGRAFPEFECEG